MKNSCERLRPCFFLAAQPVALFNHHTMNCLPNFIHMKKILLFLLAFGITSLAHAQSTRDVVFLHNGSILRGTITMQNDTVLLISTCCDNVFAVDPQAIKEIKSER